MTPVILTQAEPVVDRSTGPGLEIFANWDATNANGATVEVVEVTTDGRGNVLSEQVVSTDPIIFVSTTGRYRIKAVGAGASTEIQVYTSPVVKT